MRIEGCRTTPGRENYLTLRSGDKGTEVTELRLHWFPSYDRVNDPLRFDMRGIEPLKTLRDAIDARIAEIEEEQAAVPSLAKFTGYCLQANTSGGAPFWCAFHSYSENIRNDFCEVDNIYIGDPYAHKCHCLEKRREALRAQMEEGTDDVES